MLPLLVSAVVVVVAAGVLLWRNKPGGGGARAPATAQPGPRPLCEGWPSPTAVLVLTGEQHGYLEPCGCTERQMGGLERRADLVRQLREVKGWAVGALDLGGAPHPERTRRAQERMKFTTTRAALRAMQYDAMALGAEELEIDADRLFEIYSNEVGAAHTSPEFLAANVTLYGQREVGTPLEWKVVEVGGLKVAVTGVIGTTVWRRLFGESAGVEQTNFGFEEPAAALARVLPLMAAEQPALRVLLSHAEAAESRELTQKFQEFDIVVTAGGYEDGALEPEPIGRSLLLQVGQKGKHAGVLGIFPEGTEPRLRF
jgi:2',3'-cyclic-nucleotide 2'-phosphodiesterase (5'-nucleotidase family)